MKKLFALILVLVFMFVGCTENKNQETINVTDVSIYYPTKGNEGLDTEKREIQYIDKNELYTKTIQEYLKGPSDKEKFESSYTNKPELLNIIVNDGDITINLSTEFNIFSGVLNEASVVASFVDTMIQLEDIKRVKLLIEGKEFIAPGGEPYGYLEYIDYIANATTQEIILYFANSQAMYVVPENRTISLDQNASKEDLIKRILEELIQGPTDENLYRTIPEEVRILNLLVEEDLVSIDFSKEMLTKHSRGAAGEDMTISSLVNTLTEIEGINRVLPTVEGAPLNIEHEYITEPLLRREDRIYRY